MVLVWKKCELVVGCIIMYIWKKIKIYRNKVGKNLFKKWVRVMLYKICEVISI